MSNAVLAPGKRAPAFTLKSDQGEEIRLTQHRGRWVVLFFLPQSLTPSCCAQAKDFQDAAKEFSSSGAVVLGVSPSDSQRQAHFRSCNNLGFPLLHDRDAKLAIRYGVYRERKTSARTYLGIVRSTILIDPSGKVTHLWDNLRVKGHVARVLQRLKEELQD